MSAIILLKFFHYLGLFLAGGLGVAGGFIQSAHRKAAMPPAPPVQRAMRKMAWLSLVAIIMLWITGIGLGHMIYGTLALGWAFSLKIAGATILLGAICAINLALSISGRTGQPPSAMVMRFAPMISRGGLVLVLAGIAITTTS